MTSIYTTGGKGQWQKETQFGSEVLLQRRASEGCRLVSRFLLLDNTVTQNSVSKNTRLFITAQFFNCSRAQRGQFVTD